jgi:uncharacterized Rmd1/YagE family protein
VPVAEGSAFLLRYGALVLVGVPAAEEAALRERLAPRLHAPFERPAEETAWLSPGAELDTVDADGTIRLRDLSAPRLMVVADVLAKSVALAQQEATLAEALDRVEPQVAAMRGTGGVPASSRALLRQIGHALQARQRTAVRVEAGDRPDLLWDHPELGRLHERLSDEYEIVERGEALDRKLALIGDTVATLLSIVQGRRGLWLEVAVVVLVGIEVVVTLSEILHNLLGR